MDIRMIQRPKVVTLCGSSRFVQEMAVCAWLIEREELAIAMSLHLLPHWYPNCPPDHLAEHEGVADDMDALHLRKIDLSDEIFVVNIREYIGSSTANEIAYAKRKDKRVRYYTRDSIGDECDLLKERAMRLAFPDGSNEVNIVSAIREAE
jgi:hypothetical protein